MRKRWLLPVLLVVAFNTNAQVVLKMQHLPGHTYVAVNKTHAKGTIGYMGDTVLISHRKVLISSKSFEESRVNTATAKIGLNNDLGQPFSIQLDVDATSQGTVRNDKSSTMVPINSKEIIYGKITDKGSILIDSISSIKKTETLAAKKAIYIQQLNETQANINFPQKALKIGDSFSDTGKIYTPNAGVLYKMRTKTKYTLKAIQNEKAFFAMNTRVFVDKKSRGIRLDVKGGGNGKMVYDMGVNYPLSIQNNMQVYYTVSINSGAVLKLKGRMSITSDQQNTVTF